MATDWQDFQQLLVIACGDGIFVAASFSFAFGLLLALLHVGLIGYDAARRWAGTWIAGD